MKSLATINDKDIETIKMALNDSISDINMELKKDLSPKKRAELTEFKNRYARVLEKMKQNTSIYSLVENDLDLAASALNDAIELLEECMGDDLDEQERNDFMNYRKDCERLLNILAS